MTAQMSLIFILSLIALTSGLTIGKFNVDLLIAAILKGLTQL